MQRPHLIQIFLKSKCGLLVQLCSLISLNCILMNPDDNRPLIIHDNCLNTLNHRNACVHFNTFSLETNKYD